MLDEKTYQKIIQPRNQNTNVLDLDRPEVAQGSTIWQIAEKRLRDIAQNIINNITEHKHLKSARILLLTKQSGSDEKALKKGNSIKAGKASKSSVRDKLFTGMAGKHTAADFVVWLSADWIKGIEEHLENDEATRKIVALIDHELLHCGAKVAGEFVSDDEMDNFLEGIGTRHVETCKDITNEDDEKLVRFYCLDKKISGYAWMMRKHDIEEFNGVIARHGAWTGDITQLVDVLVKQEKTLFSKSQKNKKIKTEAA